MASHSEIALLNSDQPEPGKTRARRANTKTPKAANDSSKTSKAAPEKQQTSKDIVPVMKLRAIDILDEDKPKSAGKAKDKGGDAEAPTVFHMPPPPGDGEHAGEAAARETAGDDDGDAKGSNGSNGNANGASLVSDPELLELLEQLSATIDTANTMLDAAVSDPNGAALADGPNGAEPYIGPESSPQPRPEPHGDDDLPPLAAQFPAQEGAHAARRKESVGFGLLANTALTGLVFAAGAAWLVHTNPWLLDRLTGETARSAIAPKVQQAKDQSTLPVQAEATQQAPREEGTQQLAAVAPAAPAPAFTPPTDEEPVPMQTINRQNAPAPAADAGPPRGPAGQPIELGIAAPAGAAGPEMSVMVQGVPKDAGLSAGKDLGSGNWLLGEADLDGLTLETGTDFKPGDYEIEVIMVKSDGSVPETRKVAVRVEPASSAKAPGTPMQASAAGMVAAAPQEAIAKPGVAIEVSTQPAPAPEQQPAGEPALSPQEVKTILSRGETLLQEGDVAGARLLLRYAAERGNKDAMVKLAQTYDPKHLAKLGVHGVRADPEQATHWYALAVKAGAAQ